MSEYKNTYGVEQSHLHIRPLASVVKIYTSYKKEYQDKDLYLKIKNPKTGSEMDVVDSIMGLMTFFGSNIPSELEVMISGNSDEKELKNIANNVLYPILKDEYKDNLKHELSDYTKEILRID